MAQPVEEILAERQKTHGSFVENARTAQDLKAIMRSTPNWQIINSLEKEALEAVAAKLARLLTGDAYNLDTVRDIIGYMQLLYQWLETEDSATDVKTIRQIRKQGLWQNPEEIK